jgi:hypothetical protein
MEGRKKWKVIYLKQAVIWPYFALCHPFTFSSSYGVWLLLDGAWLELYVPLRRLWPNSRPRLSLWRAVNWSFFTHDQLAIREVRKTWLYGSFKLSRARLYLLVHLYNAPYPRQWGIFERILTCNYLYSNRFSFKRHCVSYYKFLNWRNYCFCSS